MFSLSNEFLNDEIRDEFYISGSIKRCWASQLVILSEVDKVCRDNGITYFAEWGTLLGAVRHGGYIPWDDDMDICMKREDYDRFVQIAEKKLPEGYLCHTCTGKYDYWDIMAKVSNSDRINFDKEFLEKHYGCPYAVGIDVFPLDYLAPSKDEEEKQYELINLAMAIGNKWGEGSLKGAELIAQINRLVFICENNSLFKSRLLRYLNIDYSGDIRRQLYYFADRAFALYTEKESDYLTQIGIRSSGYEGQVYKKEWFSRALYMPFEGFMLPVPIGYDAILKQKYGNYMRLVKQGGSHDYPCFAKQESRLIKEKIKPISYSLSEAVATKRTYDASHGALRNKYQILGALKVVFSIHDRLKSTLANEEIDEDDFIKLLQQCQDAAIQIGTVIERLYEDKIVVHALEEYCEKVFQTADSLDISIIDDALNEVLVIANESLIDKREIVFIVTRAALWKDIEDIYNSLKSDERNHVVVMPVPYFYKNFLGGFEESHYEGEAFTSFIDIVIFKDYDIRGHYPDEIYIQSGYDEYHDTFSIHPDYYSSRLRDMCHKLIYVPHMTKSADIMDITKPRVRQMMDYFMCIPGVINADEIMVCGEDVRRSYIDYLVSEASNENRSYWEDKVIVRPISDRHASKICNNVCTTQNKKLLFEINTSFLAEYGLIAIDKLRRVLDIFNCSRDSIDYLWVDSVDTSALNGLVTCEVLDEFAAIKQEHQDHLVATNTIELEAMDAYYGSAGRDAHMLRMMGKPVMILNVEC